MSNASVGNKSKQSKMSQMSVIQELTNSLRTNGGEMNKHRQIIGISIPDLLK